MHNYDWGGVEEFQQLNTEVKFSLKISLFFPLCSPINMHIKVPISIDSNKTMDRTCD